MILNYFVRCIMSNNKYIQLVENLFDDVFSGGSPSHLEKYFTEDVKIYDPATPKVTSGLENFKKIEAQYQQAFPDKKATIKEIYLLDDKVFVNWYCEGHHKGNLAGYPATGNHFKITGFTIYGFSKDGKIQSVNQLWDRLALMEQIGQVNPITISS